MHDRRHRARSVLQDELSLMGWLFAVDRAAVTEGKIPLRSKCSDLPACLPASAYLGEGGSGPAVDQSVKNTHK